MTGRKASKKISFTALYYA